MYEKNANFLRDPRTTNWNAHSDQVRQLLGLPEKAKLPVEGMPVRIVQGMRVWVVPFVPYTSGRKSSKHRVFAECPVCGKQMSAGRLHQHTCVERTTPQVLFDSVKIEAQYVRIGDRIGVDTIESIGIDVVEGKPEECRVVLTLRSGLDGCQFKKRFFIADQVCVTRYALQVKVAA